MDEHGKGINIEHHDHDYHPKGYGDYGHGGFGVWGIFGFIAFIVILWGVWAAHNRNSDHHHDQLRYHNDTQRGMDKLGYQFGRIDKQLDDMQMMTRDVLYREDKILDKQCGYFENMQQFGVKYGVQTQQLCTARPQYCGEGREHSRGGNFYNGSPVSENRSWAAEHCQMGV